MNDDTTSHEIDPAPERDEAQRAARRAREARWQEVWQRLGVFGAKGDGSAERRYVLTMFPYPSGDLHMGHAEVFAIEDVVARYWRLRGFDVMNPIGWDSFGLPAENAAIRSGENPARYTDANIDQQARTAQRYGVSFDWSRRVHSHDPDYYRWTQWLFLRMFERGLAYRAPSSVNWCPRDQTVLANEQVVAGRCERCGAHVTRRELVQWFFRITDYADRLLDDMVELEGRWPERVLTMQRHWIGRSTGATIGFDVAPGRAATSGPTRLEAFTTRPETLPGVTFLAVAPESELATRLCEPGRESLLEVYREAVARRSDVERQSTDSPTSGVFLGAVATHPQSGEPLPVWAADYVLPGYGTGVVMGVPSLDERDAAFAAAHGIASRAVAHDAPSADDVVAWLEREGRGGPAVSYRLRDWLVSRQRYWGTPIPIVHCPRCGEVPVPESELPVELPHLSGDELAPRGISPLAGASDWVSTTCPRCGAPASRDTDTLDTFVDSSWYFVRYCSPGYPHGLVDPAAARRWLPADVYVGGSEHAILHLLYSRFVTKVLADLGVVEVSEPFAALVNQGQVINRGKAMSKSLGNGVDLAEQLDRHGVDAVRLAILFSGPPEADLDWADVNPAGIRRFLARASRLADDVASAASAPDVATAVPAYDAGSATRTTRDGAGTDVRRATHRAVLEVSTLLDEGRINVAVARLMELVSATRRAIDTAPGAGHQAVREAVEAVAIMLSVFAPYTAEDMWERLGHAPSVAAARWPDVDPELTTAPSLVAIFQVDGKVRGRADVPVDVTAEALLETALADPAVRRATVARQVVRTVVRAPSLVNLVTRPAG